jgi:hypothetical protein
MAVWLAERVGPAGRFNPSFAHRLHTRLEAVSEPEISMRDLAR